jgi:hypothetical protein
LVFDRGILKQVFPQFDFTAEKAPVLAQHLVEFALAGLSAAAANARKENSTWK